jgi:hypothetical protein
MEHSGQKDFSEHALRRGWALLQDDGLESVRVGLGGREGLLVSTHPLDPLVWF